MARVTRVAKARETAGERKCYRCGKKIEVGEPYSWVSLKTGPTSSLRKNFCDDHNPRPSELTTSDKLSTLYAAQESAEDTISGASDAADMWEALRTLAEEVREVGDSYRESADNLPENLQNGSQAEELRSKGDELDGWADTLESTADELENEDEPEEDADGGGNPETSEGEESDKPEDGEDEPEEESFDERMEAYLEDIRSRASDAVGECPL